VPQKKNIILISFALISIYLSSCSKSTEPSIEIQNNYVPLNIGDQRQIIRRCDSSTILDRVIYETKRQDGKKVIAVQETFGTQIPDTGYVYINNGYYVETSLYPNSNQSNPYDEEVLVEIDPRDGDRFVSTIDYPDTFFITAKYYSSGTQFVAHSWTFSDLAYSFNTQGSPIRA
jgi:hypothetical protein